MFSFEDISMSRHAGVAQLAEQLICNQQVAGSSPIASSRFLMIPAGYRSKESLLILCRDRHVLRCMALVISVEGFPSGQREQTVNLSA